MLVTVKGHRLALSFQILPRRTEIGKG
jgi:hypothetical protein